MSAERTPRRFGSVRRMKSQRWQARYVCPTCSTMHPAHVTFDTRRLADDFLAGVRADIQRQRYACPAESRRAAEAWQRTEESERRRAVTFGAYADAWLSGRADRLKPRTVMLYRRQLALDLLPALGTMPLTAVTVDVVDDWWTDVRAAHPARATGNAHAYGLLKTIMGAAVKDRQQPVTANPCQVEDVRRGQRRSITPATDAELDAIAAAMPDRLALAVHLAAFSGLRFGELAELRRRDVETSEAEPVLWVTRGVVHREGRTIVGTPKSAAGVRHVYLPPHLRANLLAHLEHHAQVGPDGLLFTGPIPARGGCSCGHGGCVGGHLLSSTLYRAYGPARETAGRPDLRWHDLRHTGATKAARMGATTAELQARLGHSTAAMAMRYQHATRERDRELARRMSAHRTSSGTT